MADQYAGLDEFVPTEGRVAPLQSISKSSNTRSASIIDALGASMSSRRVSREASLGREPAGQLVVASSERVTHSARQALASTLLVPTATGGEKEYVPSATIAKRAASKWPRPEWHAPWKLYRVISGHQGWVRSLAFDPSNEWFATGSHDRTIRIWGLSNGQLKLTLTGHIEAVTGLAISDRSPYMFSCGLDKQVCCGFIVCLRGGSHVLSLVVCVSRE
jgi:pleiotropic regulator 1